MADDQGRGRRRPLNEDDSSTSRGSGDGPVCKLLFKLGKKIIAVKQIPYNSVMSQTQTQPCT